MLCVEDVRSNEGEPPRSKHATEFTGRVVHIINSISDCLCVFDSECSTAKLCPFDTKDVL